MSEWSRVVVFGVRERKGGSERAKCGGRKTNWAKCPKTWKDAWRNANDGFERLVFESRKAWSSISATSELKNGIRVGNYWEDATISETISASVCLIAGSSRTALSSVKTISSAFTIPRRFVIFLRSIK
ncbi:hypothetical protein Droror1_Dr00017531 [Drosera rotundifolia]